MLNSRKLSPAFGIQHSAFRMLPDFKNPQLLARALTHTSFANEQAQDRVADPGHIHTPSEHNEKLEFLGDAVLDFLSAAWLFEHYPELNEGRLTSLRGHCALQHAGEVCRGSGFAKTCSDWAKASLKAAANNVPTFWGMRLKPCSARCIWIKGWRPCAASSPQFLSAGARHFGRELGPRPEIAFARTEPGRVGRYATLQTHRHRLPCSPAHVSC